MTSLHLGSPRQSASHPRPYLSSTTLPKEAGWGHWDCHVLHSPHTHTHTHTFSLSPTAPHIRSGPPRGVFVPRAIGNLMIEQRPLTSAHPSAGDAPSQGTIFSAPTLRDNCCVTAHTLGHPPIPFQTASTTLPLSFLPPAMPSGDVAVITSARERQEKVPHGQEAAAPQEETSLPAEQMSSWP